MSLRRQLLALTAGILAAVLLVTGFSQTWVTRDAFKRYLQIKETDPAHHMQEEALAQLSEYFHFHGSWLGVEPLLESLTRPNGHVGVVFSPRGKLVAISDGSWLLRLSDLNSDGRLLVKGTEGGRDFILMATWPELRVGGKMVGTFVFIPLPGTAHAPEHAFLRQTAWRQILALLMVGGLALLVTFRLARNMALPLENLADAAQDIAKGNFSRRAPESGGRELGALVKAFNGMALELGKAETQRRNMTADIAHELRRPLTNMRCQLEAIRDGLMPADGAMADSLFEEVLALNHIVDDLRDLALLDSGHFQLNLTSIDLATLVQSVVTRRMTVFQEAGVLLSGETRGTPVMEGDARRLSQVIDNLLQNALAHTPHGGRTVLRAFESQDGVCLTVSDTGAGIPEDHLDHLFERFYRVDEARTRDTGGSGLGLTIARSLTRAMKGQISIENRKEVGAVVTLVFPRA